MVKGNIVYKAVIFDLDGTLINSLADLAASGNELRRRYGQKPFPEEDYKYYVGNGSKKLIERILPELSPSQVNKALAEYKLIYANRLKDNTAPYPHIMELLIELKNRGVILAVCTNKHSSAAKSLVDSFFPSDLFALVRGVSAGELPKPAPENTFDIMRQLNLQPEHTAFVGDTMVDMQTAINAGVLPVGVLWGFRTQEELLANGARVLLSDPLQLMQKLCFVTK